MSENASETKAAWLQRFNDRMRRAKRGVMSADELKTMSGLAFLEGIVADRYGNPPIGDALNFALMEVSHGSATFMGVPQAAHYNPIGTIHGGWAATLLDSCMACAIQTTLPTGRGYTTAEIKVNMVRPISHETGPLKAIGTVIHPGRQVATSEGRIVGPDGKLYAHGTTTCVIFAL
jgi:uncharacterized protein (TIGR00369 family)